MTTTREIDSFSSKPCIAFEGERCIASGELREVASTLMSQVKTEQAAFLIFDSVTGEQIDVDFRGTQTEVLERLRQRGTTPSTETPKSGPGRPKLGVVSREVTLLPRHWDWLGRQPGGASVALRKLVEEARKGNSSRDRIRQAKEAAYRFMSAMAGNLEGFEEASRALFAGNGEAFSELIRPWPTDVRDHLQRMAAPAFSELA